MQPSRDGQRPSQLVLPPGVRSDAPLPRISAVEEEGLLRGGIRTTVSIEQSVRTRNYESAKCSIMLSGVPTWATPDMIDEALDTSKIVYDKLRERLAPRILAIRRAQGYEHGYNEAP